jgi:uncharacterized protein DUF3800
MALRAFLDESGIHDGSPVLTVAAYVGRPQVWRAWTRKWSAAKRPIEVFHAVDCANLRNEFDGWKDSRRDAFVAKLLPVIGAADLDGAVIGIHLGEFRRAVRDYEDVRAALGDPYVACFQWLVQTVVERCELRRHGERLAFVHEANDYELAAFDAFNWLKQYAYLNSVAMTLTFEDKRAYPPLQAADILAYEGNKRLRDVSRPERRAWTALAAQSRITLAHYGKDNMDALMRRLSAQLSELRAMGWDGTFVGDRPPSRSR